MEDALVQLMGQSPTIAVLCLWVWAERSRHAETLRFYRERLTQCHDRIMLVLDRHMVENDTPL